MNGTTQLQILPADIEDAEELLTIYAPYVRNTAITFEYEVPTVDEFKERIRHVQEKYPYLKAVRDNRIVGYAYAGVFVGRAAYDWSVETSIYVDQKEKRGGIGGRLYRQMEDTLRRMHILNLNACIGVPREGTAGDAHLTYNSVEFHEHLGYRMVGRFHNSGYKFGTWYDMVWMEKFIGTHTDCPERILSYSELR